MTKYIPSYPLIKPEEMIARDKMVLVPEEKLDPLQRAELHNLRRGIPYYITLVDTQENRANFNFTTLYYQQVAYKEGWEFKPENWQVRYIAPNDPRFPHDGEQRRIYSYKSIDQTCDPIGKLHCDGKILPLSTGNRLGFTLESNGKYARLMDTCDTDDLGAKVRGLFKH